MPFVKKIFRLPILGRLCSYEVVVYVFFGALTTFINWISYLIMKQLFNQSTAFSNAFAWIIAVLFAYVVNKKFVFKSSQHSIGSLFREFILFIAARLLSFGFDQAFMIITVDRIGLSDGFAKILSNIFVLIMNYFASKIIIFKTFKK